MSDMQNAESHAMQLRNQWLGTDYPKVAWQDASPSERAAWVMLAAIDGGLASFKAAGNGE